MNRQQMATAARLFGAGSVLISSLVFAGDARAQSDDSPLIDAEVVADVVVEGGDAQGGDAQGGDAGLNAVVVGTGTGSDCGDCGTGDVYVAQEGTFLEGGDATGGDATGGDGLNAFVDADVVVDADVDLDVATDIAVTTTADADVAVPAANANGLQTARQPVDVPTLPVDPGSGDLSIAPDSIDLSGVEDTLGSLGGSLPEITGGQTPGGNMGDTGTGGSGGLQNSLGALSGLGGLNLLNLNADLEVDVRGGDAAGGSAVGGDAVLEAVVLGTPNGSVMVDQEASQVSAGDATGGSATGGAGIELDVILDADIDLIVEATVDLAADIDTTIEVETETSGQQRARMQQFSTLP